MGDLLRVREGSAVRVRLRIEFKREINILVRRELLRGRWWGECVSLWKGKKITRSEAMSVRNKSGCGISMSWDKWLRFQTMKASKAHL